MNLICKIKGHKIPSDIKRWMEQVGNDNYTHFNCQRCNEYLWTYDFKEDLK